MNHKISKASAAALKSLGDARPIPKRGQIKSRIAANAFHSIVYILSRVSSHWHSSITKSL
nr:hypothetical protein DCAR_000630 [Ipomoea trifida]GMC98178.1 hypothetical protein DCAR_000630 [Ipomoea batatas]